MFVPGRQLRAARVLGGLEQIELAKRSNISIGALRVMEAFDDKIVDCKVITLRKVS